MGTDLCLVWNDERVAELGRMHNYESDKNGLRKQKLIYDILSHLCYQPKDRYELMETTTEIVDAIDNLYETAHKQGQIDLLNSLKEQGFETFTDYEWDERKNIKDRPDYINPKFK